MKFRLLRFATRPIQARDDCTRFALAACLKLDYAQVVKYIPLTMDGVSEYELWHILRNLNFELIDRNKPLKYVTTAYHTGIYFCETNVHAFAVINGVINDCNLPSLRAKIRRIWKLKGT